MSGRAVRRLALAACALWAQGGCGRSDAPVPVGPGVVRLEEVLLGDGNGVRVESALDLADEDALLRDGEVIVEGASPRAPATGGSALARELLGAEGRLGAVVVPLDGRLARIHLRLDGAWSAAAVARAPRVLTPEELGDADRLREVGRYFRPVWLPWDRERRDFELAVGEDDRALLVFVAASGAVSLDAHRLGPLGGALARCPPIGASPWVRSVTAARVTRPAIVLAGPGRVVLGEPPPGGPWRFRCAVARLAGTGPPDHVRLTLSAVEQAAEEVPGHGWRDLSLAVNGGGGELSLVFGGGGLWAVGAPRWIRGGSDPRPDVVLVSLDTLRWDHTGLAGRAPPSATPALDRLAAESVAFTQAIAPAPWTLPSHVSLFSGLWVDRHGAHQEWARVPDGVPWLPSRLAREGYVTRAYTGGGFVAPSFGFSRGFDRFETTDPASPDPAWADRRDAPSDVREAARRAAEARRRLLEALAAPRHGPPRFTFVHTYAAHEYRPAPDDEAAHALGDRGAHPFDPVRARNEMRRRGAEEVAREQSSRARVLYRGAAAVADRLVEDIVRTLREAGRWDRTILVVFSDHGEELFEHGGVGHAHALWEELVRVPLVLHAPGVPPAQVADQVSLVDVAASVEKLLGLEPSPGDGRPLPGLGGAARKSPVICHGSRPSPEGEREFRALRGTRYKLIADERDGTVRLFDLSRDPGERHDLSVERSDLAARLKETLDRWVEELRRAAPGSVRRSLDPDVERELKGLGYLGGD